MFFDFDNLPTPPGKYDLDARLVPVRRERWATDLAELRMQYAIIDAWNNGATIADLHEESRLPEERITMYITHHEKHPLPWVHDRLGRCPREVILMFAVGEITWEVCLEELGTWPYEPTPDLTETWADVAPFVDGSFDDVEVSRGRELSAQEYSQVLKRHQEHLGA